MTTRNRFGWTIPLLAGVCLIGLGLVLAKAQPTGTNAVPTNAMPVKVEVPEKEKPVLKHQLTGAELYEINCNRCHQERYPTERTGAQWKTVMLHMQVRANIPVSQAKLILQFLQENSGR